MKSIENNEFHKPLFYQTGYESYDNYDTLDLSGSIEKIGDSMRKRDNKKYEGFLNNIKKLESLWDKKMKGRDPQKKAKLFELIYYWMRLEDDIRDNDTPISIDLSIKEAILKKHKNNEFFSGSLCELFAKEVQNISQELGIGDMVNNGINLIRKSIMRDGERVIQYERNLETGITRGQALVRKTQKELAENFNRLDIDGTIYPTAQLFGMFYPEEVVVCLRPLGEASRIIYTLNDLTTEPTKGILNISIEDIQTYKISDEDIEILATGCNGFNNLPDSIKRYTKDQAQKAKNLLKEHSKNMKSYKFIFEGRQIGKRIGFLQNLLNNILMKYVVLPKVYEKEIIDSIKVFENLTIDNLQN